MKTFLKTFLCILLAVFMTNAPHIALAEAAGEMIPTANVVDQMTRAQSEAKIDEILARQDVQAEMQKMGLSKDEVSQRLAVLSDSEVRDLATQMDQARYGGIVGILVVVLLVLLIIYLAKRI